MLSNLTHRLFYTQLGQIFLSVLFGFAAAFLFQRVCKGKHCAIVTSPPLQEITPFAFRNEQTCYRYEPRVVPCEARP
jgi:hypothetical protein